MGASVLMSPKNLVSPHYPDPSELTQIVLSSSLLRARYTYTMEHYTTEKKELLPFVTMDETGEYAK